jgi:hypothetical protein
MKIQTSINVVRSYVFSKHHVIPGFQAKSTGDVARTLIGLHSARLPTPFVTLHTRVNDFDVNDFIHDTYVSRKLIKLRCMRKTLHTVPLEMAPIVHQATLRIREALCHRVYRKFDVTKKDIDQLREAVIEQVIEKPMKSDAILKEIALKYKETQNIFDTRDTWKKIVRTVIKHLWEQGVLCYINSSGQWGKEIRLYGYTKKLYPALNLQNISPYEAQKKLVKQHIAQYGPVTKQDIYWWSGLRKTVVNKCIQEIKDDIVPVKIGGFNATFYMLERNVDQLIGHEKKNKDDWLVLLAREDPSLKGYYESRGRYIEDQYYNVLFNKIGEARSSIMLNGEVIGIWNWDKKEKRVKLNIFRNIDTHISNALEKSIFDLEKCLNGSKSFEQYHLL